MGRPAPKLLLIRPEQRFLPITSKKKLNGSRIHWTRLTKIYPTSGIPHTRRWSREALVVVARNGHSFARLGFAFLPQLLFPVHPFQHAA